MNIPFLFLETALSEKDAKTLSDYIAKIAAPTPEVEPSVCVGYLCKHPTDPDRLIKHYKNAARYADMYIDGTVEIVPLTIQRKTHAAPAELAKAKS